MYELPVYKRKPEAAILKPYTNMDFRDWVSRARTPAEQAAGADSSGVGHVGQPES